MYLVAHTTTQDKFFLVRRPLNNSIKALMYVSLFSLPTSPLPSFLSITISVCLFDQPRLLPAPPHVLQVATMWPFSFPSLSLSLHSFLASMVQHNDE